MHSDGILGGNRPYLRGKTRVKKELSGETKFHPRKEDLGFHAAETSEETEATSGRQVEVKKRV